MKKRRFLERFLVSLIILSLQSPVRGGGKDGIDGDDRFCQSARGASAPNEKEENLAVAEPRSLSVPNCMNSFEMTGERYFN